MCALATSLTLTHPQVSLENVFPFIRYGIMLGEMKSLPTRLIRHGQNFDFAFCFNELKPTDNEIVQLVDIIKKEIDYSFSIEKLLKNKKKISSMQKAFNFN